MWDDWDPWPRFAAVVIVTLLAAVIVIVVAAVVVRVALRSRPWAASLSRRVRWPFRALVVLLAIWVAVNTAYPDEVVFGPLLRHGLAIAAIAVTGWMLVAVVLLLTDGMLARYTSEKAANQVVRRHRTQALMLRRLSIAVIVVVAVSAIMLTFPAMQTIGASLLASAGIVSIVAGLAAQSVLGNVFAGVQLAFNDALRVDDVVVVNGEWGRVGEITLSYVVIHIWDERRLILPCTWFTSQPFENWTRRSSKVMGTVALDVDWRVPVEALRARLREILDGSSLWDGRSGVMQVTDATGGSVRVRVTVSAEDSGKLWDLQCLVREELVTHVQRAVPVAMPAQHVVVREPESESAPTARARRTSVDREGMFSGSEAADERGELFTRAITLPELAED